jgi:hypothetical protein
MALKDLISDLSRFRKPLSTQPIVPGQQKQGPTPFVTTPLADRALPSTQYTSTQSPTNIGPTISGTNPIGRHDSGDTSGLNIDGVPESTNAGGRHTQGTTVPNGPSPGGRHEVGIVVSEAASPTGRHTEGKNVDNDSAISGRHEIGKEVPDAASPTGRHTEGKNVPDNSSPSGRHTEGKEVPEGPAPSGRHDGNHSNGLNIDGDPTPSVLTGRHEVGKEVPEANAPGGRHTDGKEVPKENTPSGRHTDGIKVPEAKTPSGRHTEGKEVSNTVPLSGRLGDGVDVSNTSEISGRHTVGKNVDNGSAISGRHETDTSNFNIDGKVPNTNPIGRHDNVDTSELNYDGVVQGTNPAGRHDNDDTSNFNIDGTPQQTTPGGRHDGPDTSQFNIDGTVPTTNPSGRHDNADTSNFNIDGQPQQTTPGGRHDNGDTSQFNIDGTPQQTNPAGRHDNVDTSQFNYDGVPPTTNPIGRHDSGDTSQLNYDGTVPPTNPIGRHDSGDTSQFNYDGTVPPTNPIGRHDSGDTSQFNYDGTVPPTTPTGRHDDADTSQLNYDGTPPPTNPIGRHDSGDTSGLNYDGPPPPTIKTGRHDSGDTSIHNIDGIPNKYKNTLNVNGLHSSPHTKNHSELDRDGNAGNNQVGLNGFTEGVGGLRINDKFQASKWSGNETFTNLYTVGSAKIQAQLGSGTEIPNAGQFVGHPVKMKVSQGGFHDERKYKDVVKRLSKDGLGDQYEVKNSPSFLEAEYNKFNLRDDSPQYGWIDHPLILRGIQRKNNSDPQRWGWGIGFDDGLIRGGVVTAAERALVDTVRIAKWMASPKGLLWVVKQVGLGLTNPNVETLANVGPTGSPVPTIGQTKIHTGITSLLSVPGSAFGLHFTRHGLPFLNAVASYENVQRAMGVASLLDQKTYGGNRLLKLLGESQGPLSLTGLPWVTLTGITGPNSVYGIGGTAIKRSVNTFVSKPTYYQTLTAAQTLLGIAKFPSAVDKAIGRNDDVKANEGNAYAPSFAAYRTSTTGGDPGEFLTNFDENKTKSETTTWKAGYENPELRAKLHDYTGQGGREDHRTKEAAFRGNPFMTYNQRYGYIPDLDTPAEGPTTYAPKFRANSYGMDPSTAHPDAGAPNGNFADNTVGTLAEFDKEHTTLGKDNFDELAEKTGLMDETGGANPETDPKAKATGINDSLGNIKNYSTLAYDKIPGKNRAGTTLGAHSFQDFRKGVGTDDVKSTELTDQADLADYTINNLTTKFGFGEHGKVGADRSNPSQVVEAKNSRGDKVNLLDAAIGKIDSKNRVTYNEIYKRDLQGIDTEDFIRFYFTGPKQLVDDTVEEEVLVFRAAIGSITDSFNPQWSATQILGRADSVHVYSGWSRSFNFDFKVQATSREEMRPIWRKLNYLASWTAPRYTGGSMKGPYLRMTMGNLFQETPCFISSLNFTVDAETPWEINIENDADMLQLPHGVNVSIGLTMLMDYRPEWNSRMYSLSGRGRAEAKKPDGQFLYDSSIEKTTAADKKG